MKVGILSDTHGLLRPEVLECLTSCDLILHGGDINRPEIIKTLESIAPLHVVRGNNDKEWAADLPLHEDISVEGIRIFMTHKKKDLPEDLSPYDLVITGHTHRYEEKTVDSTVFLNPGSCGPRKETQPITMATAIISGNSVDIERIDIPHKKV